MLKSCLSLFAVLGAVTAAALPLDDHPSFPPGLGDVRSPCPALNTLANHGYLNRDGKNITGAQASSALSEVFNLTPEVSGLLFQPSQDCCGTSAGITLNALASRTAHNKVEHDASLVHADIEAGQDFGPTVPDAALLADFLSRGSNGFTIPVLAQARVDRERNLKEPLLPFLALQVAPLEAALIWHVMKDPATQVAPLEKVSTWLTEEKLPQGYQLPELVTRDTLVLLIGKLLAAKEEIEAAGL